MEIFIQTQKYKLVWMLIFWIWGEFALNLLKNFCPKQHQSTLSLLISEVLMELNLKFNLKTVKIKLTLNILKNE